MILFDTHSHYFDEKFLPETDRDALLTSILTESPVRYILHAGTSIETSRACIALAENFDRTVAAVGMHPEDCRDIPLTDEAIGQIEAMLDHPRVVAIGEIGHDFHWEPYDQAHQAKWFAAQMELAKAHNLPVILHDREAHGAIVDMIRQFPTVCGVLHSYSGSAEMIPELVKRGWYFSFSGVITFKNAAKVLDALRAVPADRLLLETDCPYLTPVPHRGKRNSSEYLIHTATAAATVRGEDLEALCARTTENAFTLFGMREKGLV